MKENYEQMEMEVVAFEEADIITASALEGELADEEAPAAEK